MTIQYPVVYKYIVRSAGQRRQMAATTGCLACVAGGILVPGELFWRGAAMRREWRSRERKSSN